MPAKPAWTLSPEVRAAADEVVRLRRKFHQIPELGFEETKTSALIAQTLKGTGLDVRTGVAKTGVVATLDTGKPGPVILYRADMDALPILEGTGTAYASTHPGTMHACGHDGHVAIALTAARILAKRKGRLKGGVVKFVFQPAEERPGGALPMIEAGVLENPKVDAAFGLHLWNELTVGTVGIRPGAMMACTDEFEVVIFGKGGHGATPHLTVDPIVVAAQVVMALQTLVSRSTDPLKSAVVTIGRMQAGTTFNVIPDRASLLGTVRALDYRVREETRSGMERILRGITESAGARFEILYTPHYPPTVNDPARAGWLRGVAAGVVGEANVIAQEASMGGEDMSYFLQRAPGCYFCLGTANPDRGIVHPHHSPLFDIDEDALPIGVEIATRLLERALNDGIPAAGDKPPAAGTVPAAAGKSAPPPSARARKPGVVRRKA